MEVEGEVKVIVPSIQIQSLVLQLTYKLLHLSRLLKIYVEPPW